MENKIVQETSNHNSIAQLAFALWEKGGRPLGRDMDFWLEAERQINSGKLALAKAAPTASAQVEAAAMGNSGKRALLIASGDQATNGPEKATGKTTASPGQKRTERSSRGTPSSPGAKAKAAWATLQ